MTFSSTPGVKGLILSESWLLFFSFLSFSNSSYNISSNWTFLFILSPETNARHFWMSDGELFVKWINYLVLPGIYRPNFWQGSESAAACGQKWFNLTILVVYNVVFATFWNISWKRKVLKRKKFEWWQKSSPNDKNNEWTSHDN